MIAWVSLFYVKLSNKADKAQGQDARNSMECLSTQLLWYWRYLKWLLSHSDPQMLEQYVHRGTLPLFMWCDLQANLYPMRSANLTVQTCMAL